MQKIQIKHRFTESVLFETEAQTVKEALEAAIKTGANLTGANLTGANLARADLARAGLARANLTGAYLTVANLAGAYLAGANLAGAYLAGANLTGADLTGANLTEADLTGANLTGANLARAGLARAGLARASLTGADLTGADLTGANLAGANLARAYLTGANLAGAKDIERIVSERTIVSEGDTIGYKKLCYGVICKLKIPARAQRVGGVVGRKCRAEFAEVLEGEGISQYDCSFKYTIGATVTPDLFDPNPFVECSHGIHYFITKEEAERYNG